jgi:hypothetical protein
VNLSIRFDMTVLIEHPNDVVFHAIAVAGSLTEKFNLH